MKADRAPALFTIPIHRAFADALAAGVIAAHGRDPESLARGLILLPNNRAIDAVQAAFVRASDGSLLMPRLVAIGDGDLDEAVGVALDGIGMDDDLPPAIDPFQRQLILARMLVVDYRWLAPGTTFDAAMAMRLAEGLARVIDQLHYEEIAPQALVALDLGDLAEHWQLSRDHLELLVGEWPNALAPRGVIDLADRRNRLLARVSDAWVAAPPPGFVVAAGITTAAPAIARLLRTVARLPRGSVVLPGLDTAMPDAEWDALGDLTPPADPLQHPRWLEAHPQFHLKLLLHRMGCNRGEVADWPGTSAADGPAARAAFVSNLFVPAAFSARWNGLAAPEKAAPGVSTHIFEHPAEEAQGIALMLREALEVPGRTAALVTPDRGLAARVAAALLRWGIAIDDSAGVALGQSPPGVLAVQLAAALAEPTAARLVALLGHPLVRAGTDTRRPWLDRLRALDRALRQPGIVPGWDGITAFLVAQKEAPTLIDWWRELGDTMRPVTTPFAAGLARPVDLVAALRDGLIILAGDAVWQGPAGRALADVFTRWGRFAVDGPTTIDPAHFPALVHDVMAATPVRKPFGDHPRLFIWGLLEARLQRADLMILGGLNEGSWPQAPSPDPWLAPGIRRLLGLAGPDRRLGLSAHDFAGALAAGEVRLTRARRAGSDPAVESRFWLRLMAMTGGVGTGRGSDYAALARAIDAQEKFERAKRPEVHVPRDQRPSVIGVTAVDLLQKDPYSYYARHILRLDRLDPIDARASLAWRGSRVHDLLDHWVTDDGCDLAAFDARIAALEADPALDPVTRALWLPRIVPALRWAAARIAAGIAEGRVPIATEAGGHTVIGGIRVSGKADRIDRMPDGTLAIVDYKTGAAPSPADVGRGLDRQLGLLGAMAEGGGMDKVAAAPVADYEYWQLRPVRAKALAAEVKRPYSARSKDAVSAADALAAHAVQGFADLVARYLTGDAPFVPETTKAALKNRDAHQLMRRDEWFGREPESEGDGDG